MIAPARTAAFVALRAIDDHRLDLPVALAQSREHLSDDRDRALTADIVTGTLRWQAALDHLIAQMAKRPVTRLDGEVRCVLRLSLYQILHLSRVPASAVVDDAVDLTRMARKPSATGFVNAVLRTTLRQRHRLPLPPRPDDPADADAALAYLSTTLSHPAWLMSRWLTRHGFDATEKWTAFDNHVPALTLRANRLQTSREALARTLAEDDIETTPTRWAPDGLVVTAGNPLRAPRHGAFVVQDEASQLIAHTVGARPGERVLDLCAAPGGKTTDLAAQMQDRGRLVACDVRPRRMRVLGDTVRASGARCVSLVQVPRSGPLPFAAPFDRVLVDAPCSGLGTLRRDPDLKWRRREDDLPGLAAAQRELLDRAASVVAPGGRLVYATCSSEPEENEDVVAAFAAGHPEFALLRLDEVVPETLVPLVGTDGFLRTLPYRDGLEAFFAAALVRR